MQIVSAIVLIVLFVAVIFAYRTGQKNEEKLKEEKILAEYLSGAGQVIPKYIIDKINQPGYFDKELDSMISFDMFRESAIEKLVEDIFDDILDDRLVVKKENEEGNEEKEVVCKSAHLFIEGKVVENALIDIFTKKVSANIKEAEDIETEAVAYHKSFGEEPEGDPVLHEKEKSEESSEDKEPPRIDELISIGTVEEYKDDLKEI